MPVESVGNSTRLPIGPKGNRAGPCLYRFTQRRAARMLYLYIFITSILNVRNRVANLQLVRQATSACDDVLL